MSHPASTHAIVRLGVIGVGNMGGFHAESALNHRIPRTELTAVCDSDPAKFARFPSVRHFTNSTEMIRSGLVDAVVIATPHFAHTTIGIDALSHGLHVLVEKPISVHKSDAEKLLAAYEARPKPEQVFAAMFNQRTDPRYVQLKQLLDRGELGEVRRVNWIITDWFRTDAYYASSGWRATWSGEGGGVLMNQCPHQLDLLQWLFGMPVRVRGLCGLGRWHDLEVDDQVTAYLEYANGASGVFVTTTGEAPGTNRLEVACERGRVVIEGDNVQWRRNVTPMSEFLRSSPQTFATPETWNVTIPTTGHGGQHLDILANFADAILDGSPLKAPGVDGIRSVELGNAMLLSSVLERTLTLPLDSAMVETEYRKLIKGSRGVARTAAKSSGQISGKPAEKSAQTAPAATVKVPKRMPRK